VRSATARARARWQRAAEWFRTARPDDPLVLRCLRELLSPDARDRVLMLAGQAFIALVPLLVLVATALSGSDGVALSHHLVRRYDLTGDVADTVNRLFERPPDAASPVNLVSLLVVLLSVNSFGRSVGRTMRGAWNLPGTGVRGAVDGLLGVATLLAMGVVVGWPAANLDGAPLVRALAVVLQLLVATAGWLLVLRLFLSRRHPSRTLLPGALFGAVLQTASSWATSLWFPSLLARNANRYGVIGIALALVAWLVVLAALIVCVGVVSAESARSPERRNARGTADR
jgi:membrane protein